MPKTLPTTKMKRTILASLIFFLSIISFSAHAGNPWGVSWDEKFDDVRKRYPNAELLDAHGKPGCKNENSNLSLCKNQIILKQSVVGIPAKVIIGFSQENRLSSILVFIEEAGKYTPRRLGIIFDQINSLLSKENGLPLGSTKFALIKKPDFLNKPWFEGSADSVWHTSDSIISVNLGVPGTESADTPSAYSDLFIKYEKLQLISSD